MRGGSVVSGIGKWFAVSSDGCMSAGEMLRELQADRVCPVMCFDEGGVTIVPVFPSARQAEQFARRNTSKKWTIGSMEVYEENVVQLEERGYRVVDLQWPSKRACTVAVLDMSGYNVETEKTGYRKK